MKYSIIIPTFNHLEDCLRPCLDSIFKNTDLNDTEIIVVSNGSTDGTNDYLSALQKEHQNLRTVITDEPLGYPLAVNMGIQISKGHYIVLLNNDTVILDFCKKNEWLDILNAPFVDEKVGITGPSMLYCEEAKTHFLIFFCVMIRRKMLDEIGILDLAFGVGSSEDIDLCLRAIQNGWKIQKVPFNNLDWSYQTSFPIYHKGEVTVHEVKDWEDGIYKKNLRLIDSRTKRGYYSDFADVTCEISTKGRFETTLPAAIISVASQELKPKRLIIFQDDPSEFNMLESSVYRNIFALLDRIGIEWSVIFGENRGQVLNHQKALDLATTEWVWRVDDDLFVESDVLRLLMEETDAEVGAVAPSCVDPNMRRSGRWSTRISDINSFDNVQWYLPGLEEDLVIPAEHLYSTFIYRKGAAGPYNSDLSAVGHREETMFSHQIFLNGWKLLVVRNAKVWHMRESTGGIRSYGDRNLWLHDEHIFLRWCASKSIKLNDVVLINMDCGIGDHYMLKMALPSIRENNPNAILRVFACYPEVLADEPGLDILSVADGKAMVQNFDELNPYAWCTKHNWTGSFVNALVKMFSKK